jgi:hypothetical protein
MWIGGGVGGVGGRGMIVEERIGLALLGLSGGFDMQDTQLSYWEGWVAIFRTAASERACVRSCGMRYTRDMGMEMATALEAGRIYERQGYGVIGWVEYNVLVAFTLLYFPKHFGLINQDSHSFFT